MNSPLLLKHCQRPVILTDCLHKNVGRAMASEDSVRPEDLFPDWIGRQTLKATLTPGFVPAEHRDALRIISERLLTDETIAGGKVSSTLRAISRNPSLTRSDLTEEVFNGNAGYTLQILWPLVSIFAGLMPRKIASSTATSYLSWLDRIRRVVLRDLPRELGQAVTAVLEAVSDCYAQAAGSPSGEGAEAARGVAGASSRVDTNEPGIYVFTTPTYLAYPPLGWDADDLSRQDFRYLKTGSSTVDVHGRIQTEIRRQTGLPEPYIILAKFQGSSSGFDYADAERKIHRLLAAARHGPEADGTRRSSATGAGTEWFITRLPFIVMLADSLNLTLSMSDDLKSGVNEMLEACELPDWEIH